MINWWLIVVAVVVCLVVLGLSCYFVVIFIAENDKASAWFPKAVVVVSLSIAMIGVLLLPFDIASRKDPTTMSKLSGIDTELMWQVLLWIIGGLVIVIVPFTMFFYEAYDPEQYSVVQQITPAALYTFGLVACFIALCAVLWITVGIAEIPYYSYTSAAQRVVAHDPGIQYRQLKNIQILPIGVSLFVYVVGLLCGFGWLLFMIYGAVGLTALPVDTMSAWMNRPKPISQGEYAGEVERIASRADMLLKEGKKLQQEQRKKNNRSVRRRVNALKQEVTLMEDEIEKLDIAYKDQGGSPFKVAFQLMGAVFGGILSLMWILHVFLYNTLNLNPFLNDFLVQMDETFSLLGTLVYSIFAFYLLGCTVKGCVKVGMRLVIFTIHPMKIGDTLMNAMLFNTALILLTSVVVTQFCAWSFRFYATNTAVDTLLNLYVRRLKGIGTAMFYFQYIFIIVAILSIFWVILCPRKPQFELDEDGHIKRDADE